MNGLAEFQFPDGASHTVLAYPGSITFGGREVFIAHYEGVSCWATIRISTFRPI